MSLYALRIEIVYVNKLLKKNHKITWHTTFEVLILLIKATSFPVGHQHHHHHHHHHRTTTATLVPKDHHLNHGHSHSPMLPPSSPMDIKPLDWREEEEGEAGATSTDQMQDLKPNSGNDGWSGAFPENESSQQQQQQQRNFQSVFESSMVPAPSPASPATAAVSRHPSGATLVSHSKVVLGLL